MQILEHRIYRGPNVYALYPVIRLRVDLGELEEFPTMALPGFVDRLLTLIPSLQEHTCSEGEQGGFVTRMTQQQGTWLGHVMEHVSLELQCLAGTPVSYGKTRQHHLPKGQYDIVYEIADEQIGLQAGQLALRVVCHLLPTERIAHDPQPLDFNHEVEQLARAAATLALGPSTHALVKAAEARNIPWIRLNEFSLIQFGHGRFQKRIQATTTSETRQIAVELAGNKDQTNRLLSDLGLPTPKMRTVTTEAEALMAAKILGFPVVVKPLDANHGRGVTVNIVNNDQLISALVIAKEYRQTVIIEKFVPGIDHRLLVIHGHLVACAQRIPGHVMGDGVHTVAQLVDIVNSDLRRGVGHEKTLTKIEMDTQAQQLMSLAGVNENSVLPHGQSLYLRSTGNLSTGGTATDMTDVVHYDNRLMAERAVRAIGLDIGGVDFLTPDITKSWREVGGAIVEVNAAPGFRMHLAPSSGQARDVAGPVLDMLFPANSRSRVPIVAITGTNGKTTTARMIAHIMQLMGRKVGLTTTDGVFIDGELLVAGDCTGPWSARQVLCDSTVDCAVLETARGGILREGLGWRWCDVGVVLNVAADHLGLDGVQTLNDLADAKRLVIEVARKYAVLNADDPLVAAMRSRENAELIFLTMDPHNEIVRHHVRAGGRAFVLEEGVNGELIAYYHGEKHVQLVWTHLIPATLEGHARFNVGNAMAASAAALGLGASLSLIRQGLRTFDTSYFQTPGRLNVFYEHPFKVILDYAHNPHAMRHMAELLETMPVTGRRLGVLGAPGDRRDEDIHELGRIAGGMFEHLILREDDDRRGRVNNEAIKILSQGAQHAGLSAQAITQIIDEQEAVTAALKMARPGDLLVIFADRVSRTWKQIISFDKDRLPVKAQELNKATNTSIPPLFRDIPRPPPATRSRRRGED